MQIWAWVYGLIVDANFVVNVGACAKSGAAHIGYKLTCADLLPGYDYDLHRVGVTGYYAAVVHDVYHISVAVRVPTGVIDYAVGCGDYWCAHIVGYVNAGVKIRAAPTITVRGGDNAGGRPKAWD